MFIFCEKLFLETFLFNKSCSRLGDFGDEACLMIIGWFPSYSTFLSCGKKVVDLLLFWLKIIGMDDSVGLF